VTAPVNRPLKPEDSFWPKLARVSGVELMCSDAKPEALVGREVEDVESGSHMFYFSMVLIARDINPTQRDVM
jgi:hypothetical protein